ncbi:MBL fold metallo-hydrolase [Peribacillus sp. FSL H8-0477]|uniref:MBL fold metallo-hydrolase n=1 Tax=Peribacillus sp. FSL H8-0477 TaxID=2921388 RepID=UPI0030FCAA18
MKWNQIPLGPLQTNCYLLSNEQECIIFDPGEEGSKLIQLIQQKKLKPIAILLTHAHFDHIGALDEIRDFYNIPAYLHQKEEKWLVDPSLNGSKSFLAGQPMQMRPADFLLTDETELQLGSFVFKLFKTPGHSPGSVSYYLESERMLFSGDVLFKNSVGRTDLPGGNEAQLMKSIHQHLINLPADTIVFSGHGPVTTIEDEIASNPFLR